MRVYHALLGLMGFLLAISILRFALDHSARSKKTVCDGECPWHTEVRFAEAFGGCACVLAPMQRDGGK